MGAAGGCPNLAPWKQRRDAAAGSPLDEFALSVVVEDGVCVDAVLSHSLLVQLLGACQGTLCSPLLPPTVHMIGYASPAAFVTALQDAASAHRAREAVQELSAKLQRFVGAMRVVWRGAHQPLVVHDLLGDVQFTT